MLRELMRDHPRAPFAARVKALLQQALGIRDRRTAGTMSAHGAAVARGHVLSQLLTALDEPGAVPVPAVPTPNVGVPTKRLPTGSP